MLGIKRVNKEITNSKKIYKDALNIESLEPTHITEIERIEIAKMLDEAEAELVAESLEREQSRVSGLSFSDRYRMSREAIEMKHFGELGLSYWEQQKMIFSFRVFRKQKRKN